MKISKIIDIRVNSEGIFIGMDRAGGSSFEKKIENVYPNKDWIKEALLQMIVDRANNEISKL